MAGREINVDLHSHSGASGGVGVISLAQTVETCALKGIDVFGTGDALHDGWLGHLQKALVPAEEGLYQLAGSRYNARFMAQSEIIITAGIRSGGRKSVHTVILFPSLACARETAALLDKWNVKRGIGRPFLTCSDADETAERISKIKAIDDGIEVIPAHVLTPQGIYGSDRPVDSMSEFFGEAADLIQIVETGLSADPVILAMIPELDHRTLISNSDCHCGALNRVGREYTTVRASALSYTEIISALRNRKVVRTAEFTPAEGRYFLTGHRAGKKGHKNAYCFFSPDTAPEDGVCPICGKALTIGVLQRAIHLSKVQAGLRPPGCAAPVREFVQVIPLVEVISEGLGTKSVSGKKVVALYRAIIKAAGNEADFWSADDTTAENWMREAGASEILETVMHVRSGNYTFEPLGYDGLYGKLVPGRKSDWFGIRKIHKLE